MAEATVAGRGTMAVETTRETVVRAATELFAEYGYHAVGMRSIADAAGLKPASLYHHFDSKADLLSEIAIAATAAFIGDALRILHGDTAPRERLSQVLHQHIAYFHEHRQAEAITRRDMAALPDEVLTRVQQSRRAYHKAIIATITDGCATGVFAVASPELAAFALLDAINGINVWFRSSGPVSLTALADAYVAMMLDGLLRSSASDSHETCPDRGTP